MISSALTINYDSFEELVECKNINCNIKRVEIPLEITKLLDEIKSISKLKEEEKDSTKSNIFYKFRLIKLIELFTLATKNKVFLQNIITYLKKVKIKCKKEYNEYTQKLFQKYLLCYHRESKKYFYMVSKNYRLLMKIFVNFTNYIIKNIDIDKKIINIEIMKYNIYKNYFTILSFNFLFYYTFSFTYRSKIIDKFILPNKYEKIEKELIKLFEEIKKNDMDEIYDKINYKELINLDKLCEKYNNLYCKLVKNIINDKEYIKLYIQYIKLLKEKNNEQYTNYISFITNEIEFYKDSFSYNKIITNFFRNSMKKLLKIINKI